MPGAGPDASHTVPKNTDQAVFDVLDVDVEVTEFCPKVCWNVGPMVRSSRV